MGGLPMRAVIFGAMCYVYCAQMLSVAGLGAWVHLGDWLNLGK